MSSSFCEVTRCMRYTATREVDSLTSSQTCARSLSASPLISDKRPWLTNRSHLSTQTQDPSCCGNVHIRRPQAYYIGAIHVSSYPWNPSRRDAEVSISTEVPSRSTSGDLVSLPLSQLKYIPTFHMDLPYRKPTVVRSKVRCCSYFDIFQIAT